MINEEGNQMDSAVEEGGSYLPKITEAYLVEEGDSGDNNGSNNNNIVIDAYAEPLEPWWKQRRVKLLLALVIVKQ